MTTTVDFDPVPTGMQNLEPIVEDDESVDEKQLIEESSDISNLQKDANLQEKVDLQKAIHLQEKVDLQKATNLQEKADLQEEIELLRECDNPVEAYQLLSSDPAFYIKLIEKNPDLQHHCNCLVKREGNPGKLQIKFKIYPEDRWTEVGYFNEGYRDDETLEEFGNHVNILLNRPQRKRPAPGQKLSIDEILHQSSSRDHLKSELDKLNVNRRDDSAAPGASAHSAEPGSELGSALRFEPDVVTLCPKPKRIPIIEPSEQTSVYEAALKRMRVAEQREQSAEPHVGQRAAQISEPSSEPSVPLPKVDKLLDAFLYQMIQRISKAIPDWLEFSKAPKPSIHNNSNEFKELRELCPMYLRPHLSRLFKRIKPDRSSSDTFYEKMEDFRKSLPISNNSLFLEFYLEAQNGHIEQSKFRLFEPEFNHEKLVELLGLTGNEKDILTTYAVDLLEIWNNYVENH